jgi:hypothetical protein
VKPSHIEERKENKGINKTEAKEQRKDGVKMDVTKQKGRTDGRDENEVKKNEE